MPSYSISQAHLSIEELTRLYQKAKDSLQITNPYDLDLIFQVAIEDTDRFPTISIKEGTDPKYYLVRWITNYIDARNNLPSKREAHLKSACTDPAIRVIVQNAQQLSEEETIKGEAQHNLFMSAENIQGNLLEEFLAQQIRPYGFLWCIGNTLHAIDFCNSTGKCLLQIKNKSNTENSSSSKIRTRTSITKWYRLGTRTQKGIKIPRYNWEQINALISDNRTEGFQLPPLNITEKNYLHFLQQVSVVNKKIITDQ